MLRTLIICPDQEMTERLIPYLDASGKATAIRTIDRYPDEVQLSRVLRAHGPQVVFLSIQSLEYCAAAASHIEAIMPGLQIVALGRACDPQVLMTVMRAGVREFLAMPFERTSVYACVDRIADNLRNRPMSLASTDAVYSFLPSKPGSGASTLAVNTSALLARLNDPALLADFDLNSGMVRFLLQAGSDHSIVEALQNAATMDEELWQQVVNRRAGMDVLHSGRINTDFRIESANIRHFLDFARRNYRTVCVDLSGNLERYSVELMHESKKIFLVCTPEVTSLHLAREKMQYLDHLDLSDRTVILLNRHSRRCSITVTEVEKLVGAPVGAVFANDYATITKAVAIGAPVPEKSDFGRDCAAFVNKLLARNRSASPEKRRFVEYFRIAPARFSVEARETR